MQLRAPSLRRALLVAVPLIAACHDVGTAPVAPSPFAGASPAAVCRMNVAERSLTCVSAAAAASRTGGASYDRILGGQDVYVKLSSSGTVYDGGTEILSSDVTYQNLARYAMGTTDGTTVAPVRIFFEEQPTVTSGTGVVTITNPDGVDAFTGTNQPYFSYAEIVQPYQIATAHTWKFSVPPTVGSFRFTVYLSAPMTNETSTLLDKVWTGVTDALFGTADNWSDGVVPDATSTVVIPTDTLLVCGASQPTLVADASALNIKVGSGSTLTLAGHTLTVGGNLDAVGSIGATGGGLTTMTGTGALLGGNVGSLLVSGSASLQRSTITTGAVSVTGSLSVQDHPLSIQLP